MLTITGPTELYVENPKGVDGQTLDLNNASATITIYDENLANVIVATVAMLWNGTLATWVYTWDTSALPAGVYQIRIVITPISGLPVPLLDEVSYTPGLTAPATPQPVGVVPATQMFLEPYCTEADIPPKRLLDSNGARITDVPIGLCIAAATDLLYKRTRRRFRSGRAVVRPAQVVNANGLQSFLYPWNSASMWGWGSGWGYAWGLGEFGLGWQTGASQSEIVLQGPVTKINSVMIDGLVLPASAYTLYDRRRLVLNLDASGQTTAVWPWNQDIQLPLSAPGTAQLDWEWGLPVTPLGRMACAEMSIALLMSLSGQDSAALPARATRVNTEGVEVAIGDALEYLKEGWTGLPIVDAFIGTENPTKSRRRARFLSPESVLGRST